ncbi:MAG TPA: hypothetical protein VJB16_01205 [archaeon]|nr:hypothetical protein [archaeon]
MSEEDIEGRLLHKLAIHKNFGHNYIARRDAIKYVPREHAAIADRIIDKLIQEGLLAVYKKGACVYLVVERYPEIRQRVDAFRKRAGWI